MREIGIKNPKARVSDVGIENFNTAYWNLKSAELVEKTIINKQGKLADNGALCVDTGEFTGRSPKDRFIVYDDKTKDTVDWGKVNLKFSSEKFDTLYNKVVNYFEGKDLYVRDACAGAHPDYQIKIRVYTEYPWSNLFANNLFMRPNKEEIQTAVPDWNIICAPGFMANPKEDGTRQENFAIINFTKRTILIGGTAYTGEIKKGIFSVLNYILPKDNGVLSMHCSANIGKKGDTAIFFGLSGTGKTTLSADPERKLIGDDEHGWCEDSVFNFEGGCYAKCIDLTKEKEPQIFNAIKFGTLVENTRFFEGTREIDFEDSSVTENTRAAYPIHFIDNIATPSRGDIPENIFFLTCDAFGVLPPISKLTPGQAMYHFISGYTAKVAGTEAGVTEPQTTFSACFGAPFLPLHPTEYAEMLGKNIRKYQTKVWLINTGWTGGEYGTGNRMKLSYTRAMLRAALNGELDNVKFKEHPVFGLLMPTDCPDVPSNLLDPRNTWKDKDDYDTKANELAKSFIKNFDRYIDQANEETLAAAPKVVVHKSTTTAI